MEAKKIDRKKKANVQIRVTNGETGKTKTGSYYIKDPDEEKIMALIDKEVLKCQKCQNQQIIQAI